MRLIAYVAVMFLIIFSLFYMLSHIWYLLTPPMELFTVKSFKVNGKKIDKMCDVVRIGGEYLIPVVAVNDLFGFKVKVNEDEMLFTDDRNFDIRMKLYDPLVKLNGRKVLLRTPPILVRMPMVPVNFFNELLHKKVRFEPISSIRRWRGIQSYVMTELSSPLSALNIIIGVLYTGLWISLGHLVPRGGDGERRLWNVLARVMLVLTILLYIAYVITSRIEGGYFY
jgi:hypothetical protein